MNCKQYWCFFIKNCYKGKLICLIIFCFSYLCFVNPTIAKTQFCSFYFDNEYVLIIHDNNAVDKMGNILLF